jgi:hypothetical protein
VFVSPRGQGQGEAGWAWRDRIAEIIKQVPGVTGVTSVGTLPLMGELQSQDSVRRRGDPLSAAHEAYELVGASSSAAFSASRSCEVGISSSPIAPAVQCR